MDKRKKMKAKAAAGTALLLGMSTISGNLVHAMEQGEPVETGEVNEVESSGIQVLADAQEEAKYEINETNFPDEGIRQWIANNLSSWDKDSDGKLSQTELNNITTFNPTADAVKSKLTDLQGLEKFQKITTVNLSSVPNLTSLEGLSTMTGVTSVTINGAAQLSSLDGLSNLNSLVTVDLNNIAKVTSIDPVLNKSSLQKLIFTNSGVEGEIDLSNLPALKEAAGFKSKITGLKFGSGNTNLYLIRMADIPTLTKVEGVENLTCTDDNGVDLRLNNTGITSLEVTGGYFEQIQMTGAGSLTNVSIGDGVSAIKTLNLSNSTKVTSVSLPSSGKSMGTLNLSGATGITSITNLDKHLGALTTLYIDGTSLTGTPTLDLSSNSTLTTLSLANLPETEVKLPTSGTTLTSLTLNNVKLESDLNLDAYTALTSLSLANLDTKLTTLPSGFTGNTLTLNNVNTDLDLTSNTTITTLNLQNMPKGFKVKFGTNNTITTLNLNGTDLSSKDNYTIEGSLSNLRHLFIENTKIKSFDSSSVKNLQNINRVLMNNNGELESIKVSGTDGNKIKGLFAEDCENLTSVDVEDNQNIQILSLYNAKNLTNDGLKLADRYKTLGFIGLGGTGLSGTFVSPYLESSYTDELEPDPNGNSFYFGTQIEINRTDIEVLDVSNGGKLNTIYASNCPKLTKFEGIKNLELRHIVINNTPNLHYLDLPNFKNKGYRVVNISGTDLAYLNLPDGVTTNYSNNFSNLVTQSIDVEIGGYDKEKGYWADLNESFPGIIMDHISDLKPLDATARANNMPWIEGTRVYGIKPNDYATYTYKINDMYKMNPKIHFVDIKLVDKAEDVPVGDTNVEITLPGGSIAESDGSFTTPGNTTVNQDGTITTESGTTVTIPDKGSEVLESGDVTTSGNTTINSDGTITTENGTTIKIPDNGSVVTENGNTTVGDITINNDGTITTDEGTTIKVPSTGTTIKEDGSIETSGGTVVNPDGTITNANGDTIKPNGNEVHIDESGTVTLPEGGELTDANGVVKPLAPEAAVNADGTILNNGEEENSGSIEAITPDKNGNNGGVVTGDTTQAGVWGAGTLLSAMLLGVFGYRRKKEKEETK
ncbi:hypothetical protein [Massilicoli timonensis]|uniref:hypothetical protein n=1 Tax=Massilicoli timonensis TaxID=2015901 RepID=UPI000C85A376|nr:hypothetical protein [Massilicoli timonensis]